MATPSLNDIRTQMATWLANSRASSYSVTDLVSEALHFFAGQYIDPLVQGAPGQPSGVATLDGGGKIATANLPDAIVGSVKYKSAWNADTNTPTLPGSPTKGDYYVVSVAGATNLSGITDWKGGDWAIYNGIVWEKIDNTDAVVSVNGQTGAITGLEATSQKDANNGYAGLDANGNVVKPVMLIRSGVNPGTAAGSVAVNNGDLKYGDGANERSVQGQHQKNQPNGYPGLDNNSKLDATQIPAFTGTLARDFDPANQQYNRNFITTLKTFDAGPGAHIMVTGFQLPARGNANLKTRLLIKFSDASSVPIENATDAAISGTFQDVCNTIMGDAATGQGANNDAKRVQSVAFEVQNLDANNDYTVDINTFRVRAHVVPRGGGTITTTPP